MKIGKLVEHLILKYMVVPKEPHIESEKIKIACIGDSITFGAGVTKNRDSSTWEYYLQKELGDSYQVLNYGISGRTLQKEGDYPYTDEKFYPLTHEILAEYYIIMLGTNDSKPYNWNETRFERQYQTFVESYSSLSDSTSIIVMTPPCCYKDEKLGKINFDIQENIIKNSIFQIISEYAKKKKIGFIDLYTFTTNHPEWFDDGVHPNYEGNKKIGSYIAEKFRKMQNQED